MSVMFKGMMDTGVRKGVSWTKGITAEELLVVVREMCDCLGIQLHFFFFVSFFWLRA